MKMELVVLPVVLCLMLAGCSGGSTDEYTRDPTITGYVVAKGKEANDLLVVSPEGEEIEDVHENWVFYDALWVYDSPREISVGEHVRVWVKDGVEESYPGLATAGKVEVIPVEVPEGATLSEAEALGKALSENKLTDEVLSVQELSFDSERAVWNIRLINGMNNEEINLQVTDEAVDAEE